MLAGDWSKGLAYGRKDDDEAALNNNVMTPNPM